MVDVVCGCGSSGGGGGGGCGGGGDVDANVSAVRGRNLAAYTSKTHTYVHHRKPGLREALRREGVGEIHGCVVLVQHVGVWRNSGFQLLHLRLLFGLVCEQPPREYLARNLQDCVLVSGMPVGGHLALNGSSWPALWPGNARAPQGRDASRRGTLLCAHECERRPRVLG